MSLFAPRQIRIGLLVLALIVLAIPAAAQFDFYNVSPACRAYDSRPGAPLNHDQLVTVKVAGTGTPCGVPAGAQAVALNVTVFGASGDGDLRLFAEGVTPPTYGEVRYRSGKTTAILQQVRLSANGELSFKATFLSPPGTYHLFIDVFGYYLNRPPVLTAGGTLNYIENSPPTQIDNTITLADPDDTSLLTATAQITANYQNGQDVLSFSDTTKITGVFVPATGTLTLTHTAVPSSLTDWEQALRNVLYANTSDSPSTLPRTVTWIANDGVQSTPVTSTINVTAINDAPAGTDKTVSTGEDTDYVFTVADFGFSDPNDLPANALLAVKITTLPAVGSLKLSGGAVSVGQSIAVADITAGNLKFTPAANANGTPYASFTFQVQDDGGTANGGVDLDASANTITINVTGVNNPPAGTDGAVSTPEDTQYTFTAADFGFTDPLDTPPNNLASVVITTLPGLGSLTLSGSAFAAGTEITVSDITAGNLKYSPVANANGSPYTTFTFQVRDDGGTAGGGVDLDASANTLTINVTAVNDAPAGTNNAVSTSEDTQYTFSVADFGFTDPIDTPANALLAVKITTLPAAGTLTLSGSGFVAGTSIPVASITAGNLKFTPAANASGSPYTTFTFQVQDDGGTASGGVDLDPTPDTMTVNVTAVNDAPAGTNNAVTTLEEAQYTFTAADFGFTDPNDSPANALASVVITTLPAAGTLTLSGSGFAAGTEISLANITAGNLKFTPAANGSGSPYATFTFQVRDDGGTAGGGVDLDPTPNTMTVNVTGINDAPAGTDKTVAAFEDTQYTLTVADFGFTDPNDTPANALASVVITTLPGAGSLTLSGSAFPAGTEVTVANITAGNLKFTPAANASGSPYATFTFQVRDDGGTANGGVDLDPTPNTITFNVTAVNDAPAGTDNAVAALEDTQYTFTASDFGFTDPSDTPANTLASVVITTLPGTGTLTLSGSGFAAGTEISLANITAGNLKFTPAANGSGTPYAAFTFQVRDNGGTANGGIDLDPTPNTMTVNVTPVNDAPVGVNSSVTTLEETQYTFVASDFGFTDPNDTPANALASVVITALPLTGTLTLSGSSFLAGTEIPVASITAGNLKFTPVANSSGSPYTTFTFQVRDNGGTANGGVDLDASPNTMTVNVTAVNDAPAGTDGAVNALEDTQYTFTAANFGFTDPNDSPANALASVVITTLPGAGTLTLSGSGFSAGTEISVANINAGNLKFTPAANGSGSPYTTFTFQVRDNGGTANGGVDLDPTPNTMTINVTPVNDAPAGTDKTVTTDEDVPYTFTAADLGFTDPNDAPPNSLASVVITTLPGAGSLTLSGSSFGAGTEISLANITAGNLKFQGAADAFGTPYTSFTFQVRDNGGTASGGIDLDPTPNTMTINVNPVNDAPKFGDATIDYSVVGNTQLRVGDTTPGASVAHVRDNLDIGEKSVPSDIDGPAPPFTYSLGTPPANGQATVNSDGTFTYEPNAGFAGPTDTFTVNVSDGALPVPGVSAVTVTVTISQMVWYVHDITGANNPAAGDDGRSTNAFDSIAELNAATTTDNSIIFVFRGNTGTTPLSGGITLRNGQKLHGEGIGLTVPGFGTLVPAGSRPRISNGSGDAVSVPATAGNRQNVEIRGLDLSGSVNAIDVTASAANQVSVTISDNNIPSAGAEGIDLNAGSTGAFTATLSNNVIAATGNAFDARTSAATTMTLDFSNNTAVSNATAILIDGAGGGTTTITGFANNDVTGATGGTGISVNAARFDATPGGTFQTVLGNTLAVGASGNGVGGAGVVMTNVSGDLSFATNFDIFADGGAGLRASGTTAYTGSAGFQIAVGAGVATVSANGGPAVDLTTVTANLPFQQITSTNSSTTGVALNSVLGTFTAPTGSSITGSTGTGFQVGSSNATVTYNGTITTTTGKGVDLTSNTGSTISFTGTLTLSSGSNTAFNATGGGTVTATDTASTLTSTTGTALNVANTTIGAGGLTFRSISSNGGSNGIILNSTGVAGGLTVTGTGSAGSGGTIQNKAIGISLTTTRSPSFNWMQLNDFTDFAIRGTDVTNFTLNRSVVSGVNGNSAPAREGSVIFDNLFGTATISHSTISGSVEDNLRVENTSGTLTSLIVSGSGGTGSSCQILNNNTTTGNIGVRFAAFNSANMSVSVSNCLFRGNRTDSINIDAANTSTVTSAITNNYILAGTGGNNQGNLGINVTSGATGSHTTTVSGNFVGTDGVTPASLLNTGINLFSGNGSTLVATVTNNTVRNAGVGSGHGIQVFQDLTSTLRVNVDSNTVSNVALDFGIRVEAAGDPAAVSPAGNLQAGVTNNNVSVLSTALDAIRVRSRRTTTLCADIRSNTTNAGGTGFFGLFTNQSNTSTFSVEGLTLGTQPAAATQTYLIGQNPAAATVSATAVTNYNGVATNSCSIP